MVNMKVQYALCFESVDQFYLKNTILMLFFCDSVYISFIFPLSRTSLQNDVDKLRDDQKCLMGAINTVTARMYSAREEKGKTQALINALKKVENELERLMEEKSQVELEEKVTQCISLFLFTLLRTFVHVFRPICEKYFSSLSSIFGFQYF